MWIGLSAAVYGPHPGDPAGSHPFTPPSAQPVARGMASYACAGSRGLALPNSSCCAAGLFGAGLETAADAGPGRW